MINKYKVAKHSGLEMFDGAFSYGRKTERIEAEAALERIDVRPTSCDPDTLTTQAVVRVCKQLKMAPLYAPP